MSLVYDQHAAGKDEAYSVYLDQSHLFPGLSFEAWYTEIWAKNETHLKESIANRRENPYPDARTSKDKVSAHMAAMQTIAIRCVFDLLKGKTPAQKIDLMKNKTQLIENTIFLETQNSDFLPNIKTFYPSVGYPDPVDAHRKMTENVAARISAVWKDYRVKHVGNSNFQKFKSFFNKHMNTSTEETKAIVKEYNSQRNSETTSATTAKKLPDLIPLKAPRVPPLQKIAQYGDDEDDEFVSEDFVSDEENTIAEDFLPDLIPLRKKKALPPLVPLVSNKKKELPPLVPISAKKKALPDLVPISSTKKKALPDLVPLKSKKSTDTPDTVLQIFTASEWLKTYLDNSNINEKSFVFFAPSDEHLEDMRLLSEEALARLNTDAIVEGHLCKVSKNFEPNKTISNSKFVCMKSTNSIKIGSGNKIVKPVVPHPALKYVGEMNLGSNRIICYGHNNILNHNKK